MMINSKANTKQTIGHVYSSGEFVHEFYSNHDHWELDWFLEPDSSIIFLIKPNLLNARDIIPSSLAIHTMPADTSMIAQIHT